MRFNPETRGMIAAALSAYNVCGLAAATRECPGSWASRGAAPLGVPGHRQIEQAAEGDLLLDNDSDDLFVEFNFAALLRGDLVA